MSYVALGWHAGENPRATSDWQQVTGWRAEVLRKPGLDPRTLIDVGAATGTPHLYHAFPDAYRVMIDPLSEHAQTADRGEFIVTAVGAESGTATIELGSQTLEHSTIAGGLGPAGDGREVPMTTLDALFAERGWEPPFGLKIDVEGYEDQVVLGAAEVLSHTQFVIAEIQVADRFRHNYTVPGLMELLATHGLVLHDILDGHKAKESGGLHFIDALFIKRRRKRPNA